MVEIIAKSGGIFTLSAIENHINRKVFHNYCLKHNLISIIKTNFKPNGGFIYKLKDNIICKYYNFSRQIDKFKFLTSKGLRERNKLLKEFADKNGIKKKHIYNTKLFKAAVSVMRKQNHFRKHMVNSGIVATTATFYRLKFQILYGRISIKARVSAPGLVPVAVAFANFGCANYFKENLVLKIYYFTVPAIH